MGLEKVPPSSLNVNLNGIDDSPYNKLNNIEPLYSAPLTVFFKIHNK